MAEKNESIRWKASPNNIIGSLSLINISLEEGGGAFLSTFYILSVFYCKMYSLSKFLIQFQAFLVHLMQKDLDH